ncbi:uncharacterized protein [Montipora capricornis]|uniref:uncharacterized protein isoform X3 n=1 Tax=Montipora capricornis TaxID=246305 RepID=UPI0035F1767B
MSRASKQGKDPKSQRTQGEPRRRRNHGEPSWYDRALTDADYPKDVMQIPKDKVGFIIGTKGWRKKEIMEESGVKELEIRDDQVHLRGTEEQCSYAKKIIDRILKCNLMRRSSKRTEWHVHVDTTQLELNHAFELSSVQLPDAGNSGITVYEVKPLAPTSQDMDNFTGIEKLRNKLLMVLKKLHKEKEEDRVLVDIWCHFGHVYITKVDEDEQDEEYFTLEEIKEKLENEKLGWKAKFKGGLEKVEVEHIENNLKSRAAKEEVRYDFTFYTPTCRYVRVKAWLTEKDSDEQEGDGTSSMAFSCSAPFNVMSVMSHALPDEQGESSHTPCFYMCSQTQQRLKADIFMPSKQCDYRLFVKTYPVIGLVPRTPQAEEEDKILERYLMGMKIKDGQLKLPPVSERPDGFDLFYQRRSRRRIYEYEMGDEMFTLLVSKYQDKTVDAAETEASDFDEIDPETDIHLHSKEWDRMLEEGNWEPEQIVAKLPTFLRFLRNVQSNVAP